MEYIQCPHCEKRYGVNDKTRAAEGKATGCKACGENFEIKIVPDSMEPLEEDSAQKCMICGNTAGIYSKNYAGQINQKKGNLFPGNADVDYLCAKCKIKLEGGKKRKRHNAPLPQTKTKEELRKEKQIADKEELKKTWEETPKVVKGMIWAALLLLGFWLSNSGGARFDSSAFQMCDTNDDGIGTINRGGTRYSKKCLRAHGWRP